MKTFLTNKRGATPLQLGIIAGVIAIGIIAAVSNFGNDFSTYLSSIGTELARK